MHRYREVLSAPALRGLVQRYWFLTGPGRSAGPEPIFPDGRPEIVFHLADPFLRRDSGQAATLQPRVLLAGQIDRPLYLEPLGVLDVVGIRFRPHGAFALLGEPLDRLLNATAALDDVDAPLARRLEAALLAAVPIPEARAGALDAVLHAALVASNARRGDARVAAAVERIGRARGAMRVDLLSRSVGLSSRQLERAFRREVGLGPKRFARVVRFQAVLRARERGEVASWAALAEDFGYADQAHLVHEFRAFAGVPPTTRFEAQDALGSLLAGVSDFDKTGPGLAR